VRLQPRKIRGTDPLIETEKAASEIALDVITLVRALYAVEKQGVNASTEDRLKLRQEQSAPVLARLREKFFDWKERLLPKHPMVEAINYALGHWENSTFRLGRRRRDRQQCLRER
jgi:hypothetical protein